MKLCIKFLYLLLFIFSQAQAAEITSIRYSKTEQQYRLVIESKIPLKARRSWESGKLVIKISEIERRPENRLISAGALSSIEKIEWSEQQLLLSITLPTTQRGFIKWFQIASDDTNPERLVIDWLSDATANIRDEVLIKDTKQITVAKTIRTFDSNINDAVASSVSEAKDALTDKNYPLAISLLGKILKRGNSEQKEFAIEFLGVARERNYQYAFAKKYYQRFLKEYPDSKFVPRVKQRLSGLIGIQNMSRKKSLKKGKKWTSKKNNSTRGSLSSDYRNSILVNDLGESRNTLSLLSLDLDVRGDYLLDNSSLKVRFSGGHFEDLSADGNSTNDRLRYANIGWSSQEKTYSIDVGRQRSRGKGIFGRFDGVLLGYGINKNQNINLVVGAPVVSTKVLSIDPERSFVGLSYDWDNIFDNIDISIFALNQTIGSLTDRRAIGGELKYFNQGTSIFTLIDYDIFYSELNALLLSASYTTQNKTRYHLSFNQRKNPYISTRNALIGQSADSLAELQNLFITDEEILDLAADRTLESQTSTLQISHPLNKTFDVSGSLTWLSLSGAPASGGVSEITQGGSQFYLNLYLRGARLYSKADSNQIGIRVSQLRNSDVWSIYTSSQYRWKKSWTVSAKLRYDDRSNDNGGGQQSISPSFRLQYQNKLHYLYTDLGAIFYTNQVVGLSDINTDIYYMYLGYRYFF